MNPLEAFREILHRPPWLEIIANGVNLVSIVLATRNSIHTWWTGIFGCALFGWLFFTSQLYADVTLQVFFIGTSACGWWHWLHHRGRRVERPVSRTSTRELAAIIPAGILAAGGYGWLLHRFTDAYAPFIDSSVLALSVAAQFLLMRRKLETWIFWFATNSLAVPLFASRGLWLTAFFYLLFWINAPIGFLRWRREATAS
ncbi:nicotinamide riboside transporter PnuC [Haloferula sargassicola]|uniref:Nicotinamide riboside transporter PnuC n=1 Tax=Haloferula sargassicola TaxID=490096 RepID=A0ABP9UNE4_9BACT